MTVLVVDDDPRVRDLFTDILRASGASVVSVTTADAAVAAVEDGTPDVVVTDLRMPDHDGVWLLREVQRRVPAMPVIAVSGAIGPPDRTAILAFGFTAVLSKPVPIAILTDAVARVLAAR